MQQDNKMELWKIELEQQMQMQQQNIMQQQQQFQLQLTMLGRLGGFAAGGFAAAASGMRPMAGQPSFSPIRPFQLANNSAESAAEETEKENKTAGI